MRPLTFSPILGLLLFLPSTAYSYTQVSIFQSELDFLVAWSATEGKLVIFDRSNPWAAQEAPSPAGTGETMASGSLLEGFTPSFMGSPWVWVLQRPTCRSGKKGLGNSWGLGCNQADGDEEDGGQDQALEEVESGVSEDHVRKLSGRASFLFEWSAFGPERVKIFGPNPSAFRDAEWVHRAELEKFEGYARRRLSHDRYRDYGKIRTRDIEYVYRIYIKGGAAPLLDTSENWKAKLLGSVIEQVDGISGILQAIDDSFLRNNLFRPSNPFRRFGEQLDESSAFAAPPSFKPLPKSNRVKPTWKWKGDLFIGVGSFSGGAKIEEVIFEIARLRFSKDFEVSFDLFYVGDDEFQRTGSVD